MKLNTRAFAIASTGAGVLLYAVGALIDALGAWGGAEVVSYIFRVDVVQLEVPLTPGAFVFGALACGALGGMLGTFVASTYNYLVRPAGAKRTVAIPQSQY
jgi:hypothetical protein